MVVAGADPRGNYGTQLWVRRSLRAKVTGIPVSTSRLLVAWLRFETSGSELMCVVGHAPHHGRPREERDQFWTEVTSKVATEMEKRAEQVECVVLIDANARVGSIASRFSGSKDVCEEDENGAGLREFAESVGIHLENTYHSFGWTWVHTSGSESRNDYVGLTEKLHGTAKDPRIERDLELVQSCAEDHRAFSVEGELECGVSLAGGSKKKKQKQINNQHLHDPCLRQVFEERLQWFYPGDVGVDTFHGLLVKFVRETATSIFGTAPVEPRSLGCLRRPS